MGTRSLARNSTGASSVVTQDATVPGSTHSLQAMGYFLLTGE